MHIWQIILFTMNYFISTFYSFPMASGFWMLIFNLCNNYYCVISELRGQYMYKETQKIIIISYLRFQSSFLPRSFMSCSLKPQDANSLLQTLCFMNFCAWVFAQAIYSPGISFPLFFTLRTSIHPYGPQSHSNLCVCVCMWNLLWLL